MEIMEAFLSEVGDRNAVGVMERLLREHDGRIKSVHLLWLDSELVHLLVKTEGYGRVFRVKGDRVCSLSDKSHRSFEETWGWFVCEVLEDLRDIRAMEGFKCLREGCDFFIEEGGKRYRGLVGELVHLRGEGEERNGWRALYEKTGELSEIEIKEVRANGFVGEVEGGALVFVRGSEVLGLV